jgi:cephalosporin hydroxylase
VDVEIRPHNRAALEAHPLRPLITLIEGSSTDPATVAQVRAQIGPDERVLVLLDSNHTAQHVLAELRAYAPLVTPDSYLVVQDGIMYDLWDVPGGRESWTDDNPVRAVEAFLAEHPTFVLDPPARAFDESTIGEGITHWPSGWLRRLTSEE